MFEFKRSMILLIWNKQSIKFKGRTVWTYLKLSERNASNFSCEYFSLCSFYSNFLSNHISNIYYNFICINFWIILNDKLWFINSWDFSSVLKFKWIIVCAVDNKSFFINYLLQCKFRNNKFCSSFDWYLYLMNFFLMNILLKRNNI